MRAIKNNFLPHLFCDWLLGAAITAQFGCTDGQATKETAKPVAKPAVNAEEKLTATTTDKSAENSNDATGGNLEEKPVDPPKDKSADEPSKASEKANDAAEPAPQHVDNAGLVKISKEFEVWIDPKKKQIFVDGEICLREGQLEMFACPKGTKEHESVVAVKSDAQTVHAALLAVGALAGSPVSFNPEYKPATGTVVEIFVHWTDKEGQPHKVRAQEWIRHVKTEKEMEYAWVFAGSKLWTDEDTGKTFYQGNAGDLVCVSNFPTATLDLTVESTQENTDLMFEAFKDRIPPRGTKVRLVFIPKLEKKTEPAKPDEKKSAE